MALSTSRSAAVAGRKPSARRSLADREYRAALRYLIFGRAVPAVLFGAMGWIQVSRVLPLLGAATPQSVVGDIMPRLLYAAFCSVPVAIYLTRPKPQTRDGRFVARSAAFGGTLMQLFVGAFVPAGTLLFVAPVWLSGVCTIAVAGAWAFAVYSLAHLRRSLSIIPEARKLVTTGPYRLVRHPLYLAEITAAVALLLGSPHLVPVLALGVFIMLQVVRTRFEERLLAGAFSEYNDYAARTHRLIPGVW